MENVEVRSSVCLCSVPPLIDLILGVYLENMDRSQLLSIGILVFTQSIRGEDWRLAADVPCAFMLGCSSRR